MQKIIRDRESGIVTRWYSKADLLKGTELPGGQVAKALWDIQRAESRGFMGCQAVFVDFRYDGLDEAISEESRRAGGGWGRGQDVTYTKRVINGKLEHDDSYPTPPPLWTGEAHGLLCEIKTNHFGALCGYVTVPKGHPSHGKSWDSLDVSVHGGVTYAREHDKDGWTIGFDCSHSGDAGHPEYEHGNRYRVGYGEYRDLAYVKAEVEELARQLSELKAESAKASPRGKETK